MVRKQVVIFIGTDRMSLPARAIYLDLLFQIYEYGGSIPSDRRQLLKLTMSTPEEFEAAWPEISKHIVPLDNDPSRLTNLTAQAWIEKQQAEREAFVEAGKRGGRPKKGFEKGQAKGLAKGLANQIETETETEIEIELEIEKDTQPDHGGDFVAFLSKMTPPARKAHLTAFFKEGWDRSQIKGRDCVR